MARYLQSNFVIMSLLRKILVLAAILLSGLSLRAQTDGYDVLIPISKYISQGNSDNLSAWFADNLDVTIISSSRNCSKKQAREILRSFFEANTPRSFTVTHKASEANKKYMIGQLNAGGELFQVTIYATSSGGDPYKIQQLNISRQTAY